MKYVMNSAVVTGPGLYRYRLVDALGASRYLQDGPWLSAIGYPETAEALTMLTSVAVPVERRQVRLGAGDTALVFRLTSRVEVAADKGTYSAAWVLAHCEVGILTREE